MKTHTQAVVIGGGLVGCSVLYHLAKLGWTDVMLIERNELTSGSTWHAAAGIHGLHDNNNVTRIQNYTMNLYKERIPARLIISGANAGARTSTAPARSQGKAVRSGILRNQQRTSQRDASAGTVR